MLVLIRGVHAGAKRRCGSPRVHAALAGRDGARSVNTVAKLMRDNDIRAKTARKFRCKTTDSSQPSLWRAVRTGGADEKWVDITYMPTREGWLYLDVVEDLPSARWS